MKDGERPEQPAEAVRREERGRRRGRPGQESRPQPHRPDRRRMVDAPDRRGAESRHEHQRHQPQKAIDQHDRRRQRFRPRRPRRIGDAHHVAADIARQEIVEEERHEKRRQQRSAPHVNLLRRKQNVPAPRARDHVHDVHRERREEPRHRRVPGVVPQRRHVDA